MTAESKRARGIHMVDESERATFQSHRFHAFYIWVVLHEILGHGTGKLLTEEPKGNFNFDINNPPLNPLTGKLVNTWYLPGQTWTGVFEDLATTVDECRVEVVGAYLIDDPDILRLFGYTDYSEVKPYEGKNAYPVNYGLTVSISYLQHVPATWSGRSTRTRELRSVDKSE